jgi:hypothetical protein
VSDNEQVELTDDVTYVGKATGIAARDLHLVGERFCDYIARKATKHGTYFATGYIKWLADASVSLWEHMLEVEIGPESISQFYERGMEFVQLLKLLNEDEFATKLEERWDAVLIKVQDSRNTWKEYAVVDPNEPNLP